MENAVFRPRVHETGSGDRLSGVFRTCARAILVLTLGLMPLFFIPSAVAPFNFGKVLFVLTGVSLALICAALAVLRDGRFVCAIAPATIALWAVVAVSLLGAVFSGDLRDAFIGDTLGVQTAAFVALMALVVSAMGILARAPRWVTRLLMLLSLSSAVLFIFHIVRILFGAGTLSLGLFTDTLASPYGAWNGLAILAGLVVLVALVALHNLPLARSGMIAVMGAILCSLIMLAVVNFFAIWVMVGVVSFIALVYGLMRTHYQPTQTFIPGAHEPTVTPTIAAAVVAGIAILFAIGGASLGQVITAWTHTPYIEVRPSLTATFDIMKHVYAENPVTGIGPNRFADAWRLYKNPAINTTLFWDAAFDGGSGYIPTAFVTTGILGMIAWCAFLLLILWHGIVMFRRPAVGPATLLLAAIATGLFLTAYGALVPRRQIEIAAFTNRLHSLVLIAGVVVVIVASIGVSYGLGTQYMAVYAYARTLSGATEKSIDELQDAIAQSFTRSGNDAFAREIAILRLQQMNTLAANTNPTDEDRTTFQNAAALAIEAAGEAVAADPTDPLNYAVLGQVYSLLTLAGVSGASERASSAYDTLASLDPVDPAVLLLKAQLASRTNDRSAARTLAENAVTMKPNYTDALFFLTQLDIVDGDVDAAIARTRSIISLEPQNPARYYQLGVLYISNNTIDGAIAAFSEAVRLDPQFANARYFLALSYAHQGNFEAALREMRAVAETNPDNELVTSTIAQFEAGKAVPLPGASTEATPSVADGEEVTAADVDETSLVTSANPLPEDSAATSTTAE
jgi:tetratricopeptide (TPR) repeat protein